MISPESKAHIPERRTRKATRFQCAAVKTNPVGGASFLVNLTTLIPVHMDFVNWVCEQSVLVTVSPRTFCFIVPRILVRREPTIFLSLFIASKSSINS